jgi:hypothetical protein
VDIVTAVDIETAICQRERGADFYIVDGRRYTPFLKWYGAEQVYDFALLARSTKS